MKAAPLISTFFVGALCGAGVMYAFFPHTAPGSNPNPVHNPGRVEVLRAGNTEPDAQEKAQYTNAHYGFSLVYPASLAMHEVPGGDDAMTIVFQEAGAERGFQIFIVPYPDTQITKERIQKDLRGAPMNDVTEIVLPGSIHAVHFLSDAPVIGASSEVWFIYGGYLFEVTTYADQDRELAAILSTLQVTK